MKSPVPFSEYLQQRLQEIDSAGLRRHRRTVEPLREGRGQREGQFLWDFSSNDYLGLSLHPQLIEATQQAIARYGVGARASMLISGWSPAHEQLREALIRFKQADDALLFSSGYAACQGVISTLVDSTDVIFCDKLNHACLVDGCRLSGAKLRVYRHDDLQTLERELKKTQGQSSQAFQRRWIITETLFGMDGTRADLASLVELAETYDAYLICDEAHSTGVYGPNGRGLVAELLAGSGISAETIRRRIPVQLGTLSKSLGSQGGFVVGSADLIAYLWNTARPAMFSTGLSIANCAAATAAIELLEAHPDWPQLLRTRSTEFRQQLESQQWKLLGDVDCPIVPLVIEDPKQTVERAQQLAREGFLVGAVRPPTVPYQTSRLRISLSTVHAPEVLQQFLQTLSHYHP